MFLVLERGPIGYRNWPANMLLNPDVVWGVLVGTMDGGDGVWGDELETDGVPEQEGVAIVVWGVTTFMELDGVIVLDANLSFFQQWNMRLRHVKTFYKSVPVFIY